MAPAVLVHNVFIPFDVFYVSKEEDHHAQLRYVATIIVLQLPHALWILGLVNTYHVQNTMMTVVAVVAAAAAATDAEKEVIYSL